jgi:hypothetical protein
MKKLTVEVVSGKETAAVMEKGVGRLKVKVEFPRLNEDSQEGMIDYLAFYLGVKKEQLIVIPQKKSDKIVIKILN